MVKASCATAAVALLIFGIPSLSLAQAPNLISQIKDAQAFLAGLYSTKDVGSVEAKIRGRVQVGDPVVKHRALLGEAMETRYNPFSDRFIFTYDQDGKPHDPGGQGFWVLTIEVDAKHTIAKVEVGIAKQ